MDRANLDYAEELYAQYLADAGSVDADWRRYFESFNGAGAGPGDAGARTGDEDRRMGEVGRRTGDVGIRTSDAGIRTGDAGIRTGDAGIRTGDAGIGTGDAGVAPTARTAPLPVAGATPAVELPELPAEVLEERLRFFREVKMFAEIPEPELVHAARLAVERRFADGEALCHEGDRGDSLYVLVEGLLVVRRLDAVVATLHPGEVVGELSALDAMPRSADVLARGAVRVLEVARAELLALLEHRPSLALGLIRMLSNRLRRRGWRQERVNQLIHAYRVRGHLLAELDPLGQPRDSNPELELEHYGLSEKDLDTVFSTTTIDGTDTLTLREILAHLKQTYCRSVGVQFMHIDDLRAKQWLLRHLENPEYHRKLERDVQLRILTKLTDAELFEQFIHRKFLGAKRFSLEGAETLIPLLDLTLDEAAGQGVREVVIGMAHRGRLNVLVNVLGKSARQVFREFDDADPEEYIGRGDVKYHLGYSGNTKTSNGKDVHISLCFNPSHLEFVDPVALGRIRAKQDRYGDAHHERCMGILIHGDAAFAGQGVVQEILNQSDLEGYSTGGVVHILVNNQIGFTTPPESGRSTKYATDVARMLQTPVFHVNGENPEAVAHVVHLAMGFRREFAQDVIVDMYCYRRHGHNEGDEPSYTQPLMYDRIRRRKPVREGYLDNLLALGSVSRKEADDIAEGRRQELEEELSRSREPDYQPPRGPETGAGLWRPYRGGADAEVPEVGTGFERERLAELLRATGRVPEGFHRHKKLERLFASREAMAAGEAPLDWAAAEALALATLSLEGTPIRFSGQDAGRGTFSHRHAVLHDEKTGRIHIPLCHLAPDQGHLQIWDSPLSETGVLGFEYGYSLDAPDCLTVWEAQFGDFCNVAQVIIDQFITSGEDKWRRLSGLVMLLPHGFEGQGPEHSSARLERFLNLAAEDNVQVVNLTTPAQLFHCLRRQIRRPLRKPLIVMSPKSLLRHPAVTSSLDELAAGGFRRLLPDTETDPAKVEKVLWTSGKLYYELAKARREGERDDVAIVRLEQYYPLAAEHLEEVFSAYPDGTPVSWVQEEPRNMGACTFLRSRWGDRLLDRWPLAWLSRPESASPATGSHAAHDQEQAELIAAAFG